MLLFKRQFYFAVPAIPENPTNVSRDFEITVSVNPVFGATFYSFELVGSNTMQRNTPDATFSSLASGRQFSFSVTATKTTNYGNFISEALQFSAATSKSFKFN